MNYDSMQFSVSALDRIWGEYICTCRKWKLETDERC